MVTQTVFAFGLHIFMQIHANENINIGKTPEKRIWQIVKQIRSKYVAH